MHEVTDVHDLHVRCAMLDMHYPTAHLLIRKTGPPNVDEILNETREKLAREREIRHTAIRLEGEDHKGVGGVHRLLK